ncbi:hypothetical protein Q5P01_008792 [Channa striata]|uniref:Uncharacterized protein n=1 Tax=Channa striata TaxID=64152 RepID=A0AA88SUD3_CHASR|nr:hypothetical protein Q5P01_008792 [Channa striata]
MTRDCHINQCRPSPAQAGNAMGVVGGSTGEEDNSTAANPLCFSYPAAAPAKSTVLRGIPGMNREKVEERGSVEREKRLRQQICSRPYTQRHTPRKSGPLQLGQYLCLNQTHIGSAAGSTL